VVKPPEIQNPMKNSIAQNPASEPTAWRRLQVNRISSPPTNRTHNQDPVLDPKALPALRQISHHHGIRKIVEQKTLEGLPLPAIYNI
jgi:hypothetical protein